MRVVGSGWACPPCASNSAARRRSVVGLLALPGEEDGDALAGDAEQTPELGHRHALLVQGPGLRTTEQAQGVVELAEGPGAEFDEERLVLRDLAGGGTGVARARRPVAGGRGSRRI